MFWGKYPSKRLASTLGGSAWSGISGKPAWLSPTTLVAFEAAHNHDLVYEPKFTTLAVGKGGTGATSFGTNNIILGQGSSALTSVGQNTAFNKSFGTTVGTVSQGNHNHSGTYLALSGGTMLGDLDIGHDGVDLINFTFNSTGDNRGIAFNNRTALSADYNDGYLRLNNNSEFSLGVYTPMMVTAFAGFMVDLSSRGIVAVTGSYGNVQTTGTGVGSWEGYNIGGNAVFMSNVNDFGLFDDTNGEWGILCHRNLGTALYYNGSEKLATTNTGVAVTGAVRETGEVEAFDTSDIRLKSRMTDLDPQKALAAIKSWRTVRYFHKEKRKWEIGYIAQEVEKDYPELIKEDENGFKMIHYGKLNAVHGAAIKALANG